MESLKYENPALMIAAPLIVATFIYTLKLLALCGEYKQSLRRIAELERNVTQITAENNDIRCALDNLELYADGIRESNEALENTINSVENDVEELKYYRYEKNIDESSDSDN